LARTGSPFRLVTFLRIAHSIATGRATVRPGDAPAADRHRDLINVLQLEITAYQDLASSVFRAVHSLIAR
jgi:hypothetical protein